MFPVDVVMHPVAVHSRQVSRLVLAEESVSLVVDIATGPPGGTENLIRCATIVGDNISSF